MDSEQSNLECTTKKKRLYATLCIFGGQSAGSNALTHRLTYDARMPARHCRGLAEAAAKKGELMCFVHYWNQYTSELARGMTVCSVTYECLTESRHFYVSTATYRSFVSYHLSIGCGIEASVLVIAANDPELEWDRWEGKGDSAAMACVKASRVDRKGSAFSSLERIKSQLQTLLLLGAQNFIVIVNKMEIVSFSQSRFEAAKSLATALLVHTGFSPSFVACGVPIIPVSVLEGDNISLTTCDELRPGEQGNRMSWWRGYSLVLPCRTVRIVRTLYEALEWLPVPGLRRSTDEALGRYDGGVEWQRTRLSTSERARLGLRVILSGVYNVKGVGFIVSGRVSQGTIRPNQEVVFVPSGKKARVTSMESHGKLDEALPDDNCGFHIKGEGLTRKTLPEVGEMMCFPHDVPKPTRRFLVHVRFLALTLAKLNENFIVDGRVRVSTDTSFTLFVRTGRCPVRIESFNWRRGLETGMMKEPYPEAISLGDEAEAWAISDKAVVLEPFGMCPEYGRVLFQVDTHCGLLGTVLAVEESD